MSDSASPASLLDPSRPPGGAAGAGIEWPRVLGDLLAGTALGRDEARGIMAGIITGGVSPERLAAFMIAMRAKGETAGELAGFREAALEHAVPLELPREAVDVVGTGGDMSGSVNVSTMAVMVIGGAGVPVIKHGGRASSSRSGSSDVLEALGARHLDDPGRVREVFERTGIAFVLAQRFHPGFGHAAAVRRELGVPSFFNLLGPLVNPARPAASAIGVADARAIPVVTSVLRELSERGEGSALVFRGDDGLDELSVSAASRVWEVAAGEVREHAVHPGELGLGVHPAEALRGGDPAENARIARAVLSGELRGAVRDIVLLNAAAGMVAFELSRDPALARTPLRERLAAGITRAASSIDSGAAMGLLERWAAATRE